MQVQAEIERRSKRNMRPGRGNSNKYALTGKVFCGHCGDVYRKTYWVIKGEKIAVWRCQTRLSGSGESCPSRTVPEKLMQEIIVNALDEAFACRDSLISGLEECLTETRVETGNARIAEINDAISELQKVLVHDPKCDEDYIAEEITRLQGEKQAIYVEASERIDIKANINNMIEYINGRVEETEAYDEALTRKLISKVTIYDKYCVVEFKSGVEATIEK